MTTEDPFDPAFDPYAPATEPVARRTALKLLVVAPGAIAVGAGCVGRRLACAVPGEVREGTCEHRFCRHHRP